MRVYCITINNFYLIPVTRFILAFFAKHYKTTVIECGIHGQYKTENLHAHRYIGRFPDFAAMQNQGTGFKVWKYLYLNGQLFLLLFRKSLLLYTPDWQVVSAIYRYKKFFGKSGWKVIYHQFEVVEASQQAGRNFATWQHVLRNSYLADLLIFPEKNRLDYFQQQANAKGVNTMVFSNTCAPAATKMEVHEKLRTVIPPGARVVGHIGNVGPNHYLKQFIDIVEACAGDNIYFVLAGRYAPEVMSIFNSVRNPKFIYLGQLAHQELGKVYSMLDYGMILYKGVDLNFEYCAPNKLYEYWSYGIPVLAHRLTGLVPVFEFAEMGNLLNFESPTLVQDAKSIIIEQPDAKTRLRQLFGGKLNIGNEINKLQLQVKKLANES